MKIQVEFESDFETDSVVPIHFGRIRLGEHILRLNFHPDGRIRGMISKTAVEDGALILLDPVPVSELLGYGK